MDYDFFKWIEEMYEKENFIKGYLPQTLEKRWRERTNKNMTDVLYSFYVWTSPASATAQGFFNWLKNVYEWEQNRHTGSVLNQQNC